MPNKAFYWRHREKVLQEHKEYVEKNRQKVREYYRNWYKDGGRNRAVDYQEAIIEWAKNNPEKVKAHRKVRQALKIGKIIKPNICSSCKKGFRLSAHHPNYLKPLEVLWLCSSCHKLKHKNRY